MLYQSVSISLSNTRSSRMRDEQKLVALLTLLDRLAWTTVLQIVSHRHTNSGKWSTTTRSRRSCRRSCQVVRCEAMSSIAPASRRWQLQVTTGDWWCVHNTDYETRRDMTEPSCRQSSRPLLHAACITTLLTPPIARRRGWIVLFHRLWSWFDVTSENWI